MPALPTPGGSENVWGDELNEFLEVVHNTDGTVNADAIAVTDTGSYYTATDVEGVLAEIAPQLGTGGGDDPIADTFGTPTTSFEFDTSSLTGLTALGTADSEDANTTLQSRLYLGDNDNTTVGRYAGSLTAPFTGITKCIYQPHATNNGAGIFVLAASPSTKFEMVGPFNSPTGGAGTKVMAWIRYDDPATYGGASGSVALQAPDFPVYLMIRVNSTTSHDYLYSYNGIFWNALTTARNPSFTADKLGVFLNTGDSTRAVVAFDYLRIWNSALTIPS